MNIEGVTNYDIIMHYQEVLGTKDGIEALDYDAKKGKFDKDSDEHTSVHAFLKHYNRNR